MFTPKEFTEKIREPKKETFFEANPYLDRARFMEEVKCAEKAAFANFITSYKNSSDESQKPKKLKIKVNLRWDESLVKELVDEYKKLGWENVSYNRHDYGLREPQGEWIITMKIPQKC